MARPNPVIHPADKALLKPLSSLGKGAAAGGAVSFLRRTEYTSSQGGNQITPATRDLNRMRNDPKRRKLSTSKDDPITMIRNIVKGFDIAYPKDAYKGDENETSIRGTAPTEADIYAWQKPKHPSNADLTLLDSYAVLPDLDALPTAASYVVTKFAANPVASADIYDERLDAAILRPREDKVAFDKFNSKKADWTEASGKPEPMPEDDYDYFLPVEHAATRGLKRKLNPDDPDNDDPELYSDEQQFFKYTRIRTYETYQQQADPNHHYDDTIALALHDPETDVGVVPGIKKRLAKGAYFYPVLQRTSLRPKRNVNILGQVSQQAMDESRIDELNVTVADADDATKDTVTRLKAQLDPSVVVPEANQAVKASA